MIDIRQTETEYLLFIPPAQKERARAINGRSWDTERKCWTYPRTNRMYDVLIAEFGDDLQAISITRPSLPSEQKGQSLSSSAATQALQTENQGLKEDLAKIHESLEIIKNANGNASSSELSELKKVLASREAELLQARGHLEQQKKELNELLTSLQEARSSNQQLKAQNNLLQKATKNQPKVDELKVQLKRMIVQSAIDASGKHTAFTQLLNRVEFNDSFCVVIGRELERELRRKLGVEDKNVSLYELIGQANDANCLSPDGIDLAHSLRKQRNKMAHDGVDNHTHTARMLLSLYMAALLWPELVSLETENSEAAQQGTSGDARERGQN